MAGLNDEQLSESFSRIKVYGREEEIEILKKTFNRIRCPDAKSEVVLMGGSAGTGKSTLVRELTKRCIVATDDGNANAAYAYGKFDQYARREPHAAIVDAFTELCRSGVKIQNDTQIDPESKGFLKHIIPDSHAVIGEMVEDEKSIKRTDSSKNRAEALNRFKYALRLFARAISSSEQPLLLFLDDLQWANESSVDIITSLVTDPESRNVLFVLAFRDDEMEEQPHLSRGLCNIGENKNGTAVTKIKIRALDFDSINGLLSELLSTKPENCSPLTDVVQRKTGGNVFFIIQFVIGIHEEGLLSYSPNTFRWEWDAEKIQASTDIADNVVDVVAGRIERLPPEAQVLLKLASCLGSTFHSDVLAATKGAWEDQDVIESLGVHFSTVTSVAEKEISVVLDAALRECMLEKVSQTQYKFSHDRIVQAAYSLIPKGRGRDLLHYRIGHILWDMSKSTQVEEWLMFLAADQLNRGADCIKDAAERFSVAELNLQVAEEAISSGAFISAAGYLESSNDLLDSETKWDQNYDISLRLCNALVETEYCRANFDRSIRVAHDVLANTKSVQDDLRTYFTLVHCYSSSGNYGDALKTGFQVLAKLGEPFPKKPRLIHVVHEFFKTSHMLKGKSNEYLLNLPEMEDANKIGAMRLMSSLWMDCVVSQSQEYLLLLTFRMVQISLRCGICAFSAVGFAVYGMVVCGGFNSLKKGYRFGPLALELLDKLNGTRECLPRVYIFAYCGIKHFRTPLHQCASPFLESYSIAMSTGDIEYALVSALHYCMFYYFSGMRLGPIEKDMRAYCDQMEEYKQETSLLVCAPYRQCVLNLMGLSDNTAILTGDAMEQEEFRKKATESNNMQALTAIALLRMQLAYYFNETDLAKELLKESQGLGSAFKGTHWGVAQTFFEGLVSISIARETKVSVKKRSYLKVAQGSIKKMKNRVEGAACNCLHMYLLLKAEYSSLTSSKDVKSRYDSAISTASRAGFLNDKALSNELAGKFFLAKGDTEWASYYLTQAYESYVDWGAQAKADQLQRNYLELIKEAREQRKSVRGVYSRRKFSSVAASSHRRLDHLEIKSDRKSSIVSVSTAGSTEEKRRSSDRTSSFAENEEWGW